MIDTKDAKETYISHFRRITEGAADAQVGWLPPIREAAMARFTEMGFPTIRDEEWRYTNVAPIADRAFEPAGAANGQVGRSDVRALHFADTARNLIVFVNGCYSAELSSATLQQNGVKMGSLAAVLDSDAQFVASHLTQHAAYQDNAFTALNTALMEDGAFVYVPKGRVVEDPIHLLFVATTGGRTHVAHPRNLIVMGANSQATIVESYVGLDGGVYFTNAVTEIVADESAVVDHYKIVREADEAFHVGTLQLHQCRSSNVTSHCVSLGGGLVRNNIHAILDGEGCECTLNGLYMVGDTRHVDNHLVVEHAKPRCNSREFFKGVLDGRGRGIFSGRIIVREGAQKTDAKQTNMSLLLSEDAQVESKPQLEIFADDVRCTHGATIGQVDKDAIFYLRSRGIDEEAARKILVYAFARESVERIRLAPLRAQVEQWVDQRISQGQLLREAV